ncbi:MAG: hypothetical protein NTZ59_02305 [Bacteroidetes bacterium]|nr:hypothetical protein [Bacteroidota bacterium]
MQPLLTQQDINFIDALNPQTKALLYKGLVSLRNLTSQCIITSNASNMLTKETADYWSVIINHCESVEMVLMADDNVKAIV